MRFASSKFILSQDGDSKYSCRFSSTNNMIANMPKYCPNTPKPRETDPRLLQLKQVRHLMTGPQKQDLDDILEIGAVGTSSAVYIQKFLHDMEIFYAPQLADLARA